MADHVLRLNYFSHRQPHIYRFEPPKREQMHIVIDIGSKYCKIGFSNEPAPRKICKTHLRYIGNGRATISNTLKQHLLIYPNSSYLKPSILTENNDNITSNEWEDIIVILLNDLLFEQLPILWEYNHKYTDYSLILLLKPSINKLFKKILLETLIKHNKFISIRLINPLKSALLSTGYSNGIVVDIGYHKTKIQCIDFAAEENTLLTEYNEYNIGFNDVFQSFKQLVLFHSYLDLNVYPVDNDQIEKAITRTCFVQPFNEHITPNSVSWEFTNNKRKQSAFIKIRPIIRRQTYEILFESTNNIALFVLDQLLKYPMYTNNIMLIGGTTQIIGFRKRFIQEIQHNINNNIKYEMLKELQFNLIPSEFTPNTSIFVGASIYAQLLSSKHYMISMDDKDLMIELVIGYIRQSHFFYICNDLKKIIISYCLHHIQIINH